MNIAYLHSHDTGRYIQPYGHAVHTPNLQRLAEQGTLFRDAHSVAPTCSPSRAGLLTGQSAHAAGMVGLAHLGGRLAHPERHLAVFLRERGYETVLAGLHHVGPAGTEGYTQVGDANLRHGHEISEFAQRFLRERNPAKPFFLDCGYTETHRTEWACHGFNQEHHVPRDGHGNAGYVMPPPVLPDTPETRRDWLDYRHSVERLDAYHGQVLDELERQGILDDTLVLCTTDHGLALPQMKCKLTAHGTGVLQIVRFPKGLGQGQVLDALVSHLDVFPTICELLGAEPPGWLEGRSLLPLVRGDAAAIRDEAFSEVTFHAAFEPKRAVRTKQYCYIRNYALPHREILPNCDDGHAKRYLMRNGMPEREAEPEELYDLTWDPQETNNVATDPAFAGVRADLAARLDAWMRSTDDPLLHDDPAGVLPLPMRCVPWSENEPDFPKQEWDPAQWAKR
ncbi:MAG: sulfatase [Opitutales bacterium]